MKPTQFALTVVVVVVAVVAAARPLTQLVHALVPLVLTAGVVAAVLQLIHYFTRR
jgi:hypothetical protein